MLSATKTGRSSRGDLWTVDVSFCPNGSQPRSVELLGEPQDWLNPIALQQNGQCWITTLELPSGVYAYKFRVDRKWLLDPDNPRTRSRGGQRNTILSLGGTPEPVLFAPSPPWFFRETEGATVLTAALRKGAGQHLAVLWSEGEDRVGHRFEMEPVLEEDEHELYRARLPLSAQEARILFLLEDGARVGQQSGEPFVLEDRTAQDALPSWWLGSCVYTIFVDRFRPEKDHPQWGSCARRDAAAGGHLEGIRRSLAELHDLGVNILYLTPIHCAAHCHRYDVVDPLRVDPALGGDSAFRRLLEEAHGCGMRIFLDFSFAHVGRGFPAYEDVLRQGRASKFAEWFQWKKGEPSTLRYYGKRRDAPLLNLQQPQVQSLVLEAVDYWAAFGIDGLRLDAAAEVPHALGRAIRDKLRARCPEALVLGEVVPEHAWRWRVEGVVDVATDFGYHAAVNEYVAKRTISAPEASRWIVTSQVSRGGPEEASVRFLSTHDHTRFATYARLQGDKARVALGLLLLLSSPGVPCLLYGEEVGLAADLLELLPEAVWEDRAPMPWDPSLRDEHLRSLVRRLLALRKSSPALTTGSHTVVFAEGPLLVFRREARGEVIDVATNASAAPIEFDLEDDVLDRIEPLATVGDVRIAGQAVTLGADAGLVARRRRSPGRLAAQRRAWEANRLARDIAFAAGAAEGRLRPCRIDLTVTEKCYLKCRHCLNRSPARTAARTARTLSAAVLERLQEDFAFADYFGFVHGGESLQAPIFFTVLQAIQAAVGTRPHVIHLLSNGLLLEEDWVYRFAELGGNSLSLSLDGASAAVNNSVRGCFDQVVENVANMVVLRKALKLDLRLGLSFVVLRRNLHEVHSFVELAARLGVDWIKFEEFVPAGLLGAEEVVEKPDLSSALQRGRALGLVVVDHTCPPQVWRCRLQEDKAAAEFLAADEFANRSHIHPCRAAWDRACIDPNGDVHAADFYHPILGNIMQDSLESIWKSEVARAERRRHKASWICSNKRCENKDYW